jgi:recombination protein RecA
MADKALTPEEFYKKLSKDDKDAIRDLNNKKKLDLIPTGSWILDSLIGDGTMTGKPGGFPRGQIVEIFGDESSGKTTLALSTICKAQEMGGMAVLMDFEQSFHAPYASELGVNLNKNKFMVFEPMSFQQGARCIKDCLMMKPAIIVIDSVSAMLPQQVLDGKIDEAVGIGLQARLMSAFLNNITKFLKSHNTLLLFTNQLRSVIKKSMYDTGPDEESSGGRALKFYSSVRLKLKTSTVEKINAVSKLTGKEEKEPVNVKVKATVVKNKIDKPWFTAPIYIRFGEGIDNVRSIIELAVNTGTIKKTGAFFTFTQGNETLIKVQGQEQLWQTLNDDSKLYNKVKASLVIKEDTKTKEQYKNEKQDLPPDEMEDMLNSVADDFIQKEEDKKKKKEDTE